MGTVKVNTFLWPKSFSKAIPDFMNYTILGVSRHNHERKKKKPFKTVNLSFEKST